MTIKRIDLRFINSGISPAGIELLVDELKRMYEREDELLLYIRRSNDYLEEFD